MPTLTRNRGPIPPDDDPGNQGGDPDDQGAAAPNVAGSSPLSLSPLEMVQGFELKLGAMQEQINSLETRLKNTDEALKAAKEENVGLRRLNTAALDKLSAMGVSDEELKKLSAPEPKKPERKLLFGNKGRIGKAIGGLALVAVIGAGIGGAFGSIGGGKGSKEGKDSSARIAHTTTTAAKASVDKSKNTQTPAAKTGLTGFAALIGQKAFDKITNSHATSTTPTTVEAASIGGGSSNGNTTNNSGGMANNANTNAGVLGAKPPQTAHEKMLAAVREAKTVGGATRVMVSKTPAQLEANIHEAFNEAPKIAGHTGDAEGSVKPAFKNPAEMGKYNGMEGTAFNAKANPAYAANLYNAFHGNPNATQLPDDVSNEQALKYIEGQLEQAVKSGKFAVEHPTGTFTNRGYQDGKVFPAGIIQLHGDKAVFTITNEDGSKVFIKVENGCFNILGRLVQKVPRITTETPQIPGIPQKVVPGHDKKRHEHSKHFLILNPQFKPTPPPKHHTPPTPPATPPATPPNLTPKGDHDPAGDPTGAPGENAGSGTGTTPATSPGQGPSGQPANPNGTVGGEQLPAAPAPAPTPPPLETSGSQTPPANGQVESGSEGGSSQPASNSTSTATSSSPNINGAPAVPQG